MTSNSRPEGGFSRLLCCNEIDRSNFKSKSLKMLRKTFTLIFIAYILPFVFMAFLPPEGFKAGNVLGGIVILIGSGISFVMSLTIFLKFSRRHGKSFTEPSSQHTHWYAKNISVAAYISVNLWGMIFIVSIFEIISWWR